MIRPMPSRVRAVLLAWLYATVTTAVVSALCLLTVLLVGLLATSTQSIEATSGLGEGLALSGILLIYVLVFAFGYGALAFGLGIGIIGLPFWWALHRLGWVGPKIFMATGAALSVVGGAWLFVGMQVPVLALLLAIPGAVAGRTLWREAYQLRQKKQEGAR